MPEEATVSFESFMHKALYDPERGYYSRHIAGVGGRGDFTTAPMLTDSLGAAVAAWARGALRETRCRNLIEIGPGEGRLALSVLRHLPKLTRIGLRLHLVECSEPLAAIQRRTLGTRARWHASPAAALQACGGRAVIWSNELVDAFPVRRFRLADDGWRELGVCMDGDGIARECLMPAAALPSSSIFQQPVPVGHRVEVHESYHRWLAGWLPGFKAGRMLTIDYGAEAARIYQRRPHGTVRAYLLQQRLDGPAIYQNVGRQDITADVNFTDLGACCSEQLETRCLMPLHRFLGPGAPAFLSDPNGPGGAFLVLEQAPRN
jgi:SAM-dependent MidA family methyltransferase